MKLSRKLLPALAMLVMSAVMLTTASFAWFATNSQVTAQNMTVNIKSDSAYLLIGTENSHTDIQSANTTAATATAVGDTTLSPVAHEDITYATVGTPGNWYW